VTRSLGEHAPVAPSVPSVSRAVLREVGQAAPVGRQKECRCGHGKRAHQHYRRGTDCALCGCGSYSRPWTALFRLPGR
jgi:hypothetical protein